MKKMNVIRVFLLTFVVALLASCGGQSPKSIEMSIWKQLEKGNYKEALAIMKKHSPEMQSLPDEQIEALATKVQTAAEQEGTQIEKVEFVSEELSEDGKTATITVKVTGKDGNTTDEVATYTKGDDGKWSRSSSMK